MRCRHHPTVSRINLVEFLEPTFPQNLEQKLVRKFSLLSLRGRNPFVDDEPFDAADRFFLGDTGVGHAIEMALQKLLFLLWTELAIIGQALVFCARDKIE